MCLLTSENLSPFLKSLPIRISLHSLSPTTVTAAHLVWECSKDKSLLAKWVTLRQQTQQESKEWSKGTVSQCNTTQQFQAAFISLEMIMRGAEMHWECQRLSLHSHHDTICFWWLALYSLIRKYLLLDISRLIKIPYASEKIKEHFADRDFWWICGFLWAVVRENRSNIMTVTESSLML